MLVRRRKRVARPKGTAMVEMALILPLFLALVFGQIESMRLGMVAQLLSTAAREGCRVAVVNGRTQADVQARINAVLTGSGINVGSVYPAPSNWAASAGGTPVTVSLSVPYKDVSWLPTPWYLKSATIKASATMSSERP